MSETTTLQHRIDGPEDNPGAPVLVLGPSLGTTWHMWDRQIPALSRRWRVLRYDLPGHGGSPARPASAVEDLADRLLATLDLLGVDRFHYAGCSLGAAVGIDLALRHPQRVAGLALVSAAPRFGSADAYRQRGVMVRANGLDPIATAVPERWFTPAFVAAQPAIADWAVRMVRTTEPGCYIAACEALADFDATGGLARVGVPTLVLAGAEDQVTPPADARVLVAGIPDARLALVPGAAHLAPIEQPAAVTDLLARHFAAAERSAGPGPARASGAPRPAVPPQPPAQAQAAPAAAPPVVPVAELGPAERPGPGADTRAEQYERGMRVRRQVLGDAHVDRVTADADDVTADFQDLVTRYAWGDVWSRPGIDRRTRSVVTLTALASRGHLEELALHTRAALRNGLTPAEITEVLLHTAVYCGVPAASSAFAVAQGVIREETAPEG
ncbi:4-carboxymuconolactone decarboxylase [Streptomyces sp. B1866]|uniref:bifunctional 3-oxoadipate enol-lactonase/4-carboxymuconolactone decarboxylase PcaDC n=1 Tax=Streptomyces sp. B1866 TaxID=3075431 RepID=UPI0028929493|nr:4-carboxymuconolactone decarboxylase [Streptomyces sp. B1866]MDT3398165.1 4-carboxymuconolactone decarboxylase [Streptomyces sp. B1866]